MDTAAVASLPSRFPIEIFYPAFFAPSPSFRIEIRIPDFQPVRASSYISPFSSLIAVLYDSSLIHCEFLPLLRQVVNRDSVWR